MFFQVFGGLSLFLIGMKYMSEGVQATAGKKLRSMIAAVTDNRFAGCATGVIVTSIIQSSSITTVLLVGLVNAGVMSLQQSIGVILGANIGTTITGWLVSLDVLAWGLPIMAFSSIGYLFAKNEKVKLYSMVILGIGMLFFGLEMMKEGIGPLKENEGFRALFSRFTPNTIFGLLKCILIGALVTAVIQSSSATVAITITLATTGVIELNTAIALVLGENIGTTITAGLASIGGSIAARRVSCAHVVSKTIGVIVIVFVFALFMKLLTFLWASIGIHDTGKQIAFAHTLFNLILVALFLAVTGPFTKLIMKIIPDGNSAQKGHRITYLDVRMLSTPAFGIQQSAQEIIRMSDRTRMLMSDLRAFLLDQDNEQAKKAIFEGEAALDEQQREIIQFLAKLVRGSVTTDMSAETRKQIRIADEYESISDYIAGILKLILRREQNAVTFSEKANEEILAMHDKVTDFIAMVTEGLRPSIAPADYIFRINTEDDSLKHLYKTQRNEHMNRIVEGKCEALPGMIYADVMQSYRKIIAHAHNIAEAIAGEK